MQTTREKISPEKTSMWGRKSLWLPDALPFLSPSLSPPLFLFLSLAFDLGSGRTGALPF